MKPEYAQVLLALIEADATAFADACTSVSPDDAEALANETIDWLSVEAGTEEDTTEDAE
jgi:hypothetical protein